MKYMYVLFLGACLAVMALNAPAKLNQNELNVSGLKNFQINSETMVSAGVPDNTHLEVLAKGCVNRVVDLIPGDRQAERQIAESLGMQYHNISVDWHNPTLADFERYTEIMNEAKDNGEVVLTHCKLNWRGSAFTYLYRVTQLNEDEATARADMEAIWTPNETWRDFIEKVKTAN